MNGLRTRVGNLLFHLEDRLGAFRLEPGADPPPLAVLMFHGLSNDAARIAATRGMDIRPTDCLRQIRFFTRQGYRPVLPRQLDDTNSLPPAPGYLLITFDDAYMETFGYLRAWMTEYDLPFLLAVCPGIAETDRIYWWEELWARFDRLPEPLVWESPDGSNESFRRDECDRAEAMCRALSARELDTFLNALREATSATTTSSLRASPFVHATMRWKQIAELSKHPRCQLAAHSTWHQVSTTMSQQDLARDSDSCRTSIESRCQEACTEYVYPNGIRSDATDSTLRSMGYLRSYITDPGVNRTTHRAALHRIHGDGLAGHLRGFGGRWRRWHRPPGST